MPPLIHSPDSHVFVPPDLWQTRIDAPFRDRAPRVQRIDGADQIVAEGIRSSPGSASSRTPARGSRPPRPSPPRDALKTCTAARMTPSNTSRTWRSMGSPVSSACPRSSRRPPFQSKNALHESPPFRTRTTAVARGTA